MDKICCVGDMQSIDGDVDAAVEARTLKGWNKFRQLGSPNNDVSLLLRGKLQTECAKLCVLHGSRCVVLVVSEQTGSRV